MKKMKTEQAVLPNPCLEEEEEETDALNRRRFPFPLRLILYYIYLG
jgi:hypothetical protein